MPYIFIDDGAPEASDYDSNYVFVDEEELRKAASSPRGGVWRRLSGWWCLHPTDKAGRN